MNRSELEAKTKAELVELAKEAGLEVTNQSKADLVDALLSLGEEPVQRDSGQIMALTVYLETHPQPVGVQGILFALHRGAKLTAEGWNALVEQILSRKTA